MAVFSLSTRATLRPGYCGRLELIWKQEAVDGLLGPVLSEAADGNLVAFFCEVVDDAVNIGFCSMCFSDLFGENALLDDDFATIEKLGEDVNVCGRGGRLRECCGNAGGLLICQCLCWRGLRATG